MIRRIYHKKFKLTSLVMTNSKFEFNVNGKESILRWSLSEKARRNHKTFIRQTHKTFYHIIFGIIILFLFLWEDNIFSKRRKLLILFWSKHYIHWLAVYNRKNLKSTISFHIITTMRAMCLLSRAHLSV